MSKPRHCRHGLLVYPPDESVVGRSLHLYGEVTEAAVQLFQRLVLPGGTVLDIGADVGTHTVPLAQFVGPQGRVLAFEPRRGRFYCLCANMVLNDLPQVICRQEALGETPGTLEVLDGHTVGETPWRDASTVPVVRVDDLGLKACTFIKITAGAMGQRILAGASATLQRFHPLLYVEDDRSDQSAALRAFLQAQGYILYLHRPPLFNSRNFAGLQQNVFANRVVPHLFAHHRAVPCPIDPAQCQLLPLHPESAAIPAPGKKLDAAEALALAREYHRTGDLAGAEDLYRQVLDTDPANAQVWYLLGAACAARGAAGEAVSHFRRAVQHQPEHASAHNHLGVALVQQRHIEEAIASFRQALRLKPELVDAHCNLGLALEKQGQLAEATDSFRAGLRWQPDNAQLHTCLLRILRRQGRLDEAETLLRQTVRQQPRSPTAHNELGVVLLERGHPAEALPLFRRALELDAGRAEVHNNLGLALAALGKTDEAVPCYQEALRLKPDFAHAYNNLGVAYRAQDRAAESEACCRQAILLCPESAEGHNNLALALLRQHRREEALVCLQEALRRKPDLAQAHANLAAVFWHQGRLAEAKASCREALRLQPDLPEALNNLGNVLRDLSRFDEALACFDRVCRIKSDYPDAHWNRSLLLLTQGDLERGWAEYEWRWRVKNLPRPRFDHALWDGSRLEGRTILLHSEQGLGDTIQFVRYAALVKERGGRVVLMCQKPLVRLLKSCPGVDHLLSTEETPPPFDVQAPLLSLPGLLGTTLTTIPAAIPYLKPSPARVKRWRRELAPVRDLRVGIAWQGFPGHRGDQNRSVPVTRFAPLTRVPGVRLFSLQKGHGSEQLAPSGLPVEDLASRLVDFEETAAVMKNLDLVVAVDTAVVHLAGALEVPVWVALPHVSDWRWLLDREDSPWYPTLRLFRQQRYREWDEVFERLAQALAVERSRVLAGRGGSDGSF